MLTAGRIVAISAIIAASVTALVASGGAMDPAQGQGVVEEVVDDDQRGRHGRKPNRSLRLASTATGRRCAQRS